MAAICVNHVFGKRTGGYRRLPCTWRSRRLPSWGAECV